ncbi:MAG: IS66 family transposase [Deltaproteobacteria bacterium]|nr:IS66 family transposase [Deltaproteobacteria bacterium]
MARLVKALVDLRDKYIELAQENAMLRKRLEQEKVKAANKEVNKPCSKRAEWEKDKPEKQGGKKKRAANRKPREGAGNRPKNLTPNHKETATVENCDICGKDLSDKRPLESTNDRIIEDIPEPPQEPVILLVSQQKKYCDECRQVVTAKSERALPGSDIGINATVMVCYLSIALSLPYTKIKEYLATFFHLKVSTSGLSRHLIWVSKIMHDVYDEILRNIQNGARLHADETGWRVRGRNWWLWVFGTQDTAYFTVDKTRGSDVVRRVLGEIFFGVLVVDGWRAYLCVLCEQQSCLSHLLRKIRKFREAFPELADIMRFYVKFRRIIRDGERLQKDRDQLGEIAFQRRLERLKRRLADLLRWPNPSNILADIIAKVKRQQPRILTFVEHPGLPFHNNYAEYLIRIGVIKRKISGGSVSAQGAEAYAILLSIYLCDL